MPFALCKHDFYIVCDKQGNTNTTSTSNSKLSQAGTVNDPMPQHLTLTEDLPGMLYACWIIKQSAHAIKLDNIGWIIKQSAHAIKGQTILIYRPPVFSPHTHPLDAVTTHQ